MNLKQSRLCSPLEYLDLAVADLGARGGVDEDLKDLAWATTVIGFEPEPESAKELAQKSNSEWRRIEIIPVAVAGSSGTAELHLPKSPEGASLLPHNPAMVDLFGHESLHETKRKIDVETTTLDELKTTGRLRRVDYLKIDIEGAELDVLKAGKQVLDECVALKVECSFLEQRLRQPKFWEVIAYLQEHHFQVVDVQDIHRWRRRNLPVHPMRSRFVMPYSRGQVAQADWIFLREPPASEDVGQALRLTLVACALGYFDFAVGVLRNHGELGSFVRSRWNLDLEKELGHWSAECGRQASRRASLSHLRQSVPLVRSLLGVLPHASPKLPY